MIIRVDAGMGIGLGHLVRCLAIADSLSEGGASVVFAVHQPLPVVEDFVRSRGHDLHTISADPGGEGDAAEVLELAGPPQEVVLIDGYRFDDTYERRLRDGGLRIAALDDFGHANHVAADVLINADPFRGDSSAYPATQPETLLLLGAAYLPLRQEVVNSRRPRKVRTRVEKVLLTFGGGDLRGSLIPALGTLQFMEHEGVIIHAAGGLQTTRIEREEFPSVQWISEPAALPSVMAEMDLAICAGGVTSYELAFLGIPTILLPSTSAEAVSCRELAARGIAIDLGYSDAFPAEELHDSARMLNLSPARRQRMVDRGRDLFDGLGAQRIADVLIALARR